jgi:asparagine synthase (glutamine-hydrolysing)
MSAIAGIWRFDDAEGVQGEAERMSGSLAMYGPDRGKILLLEARRVALVWRQFSVLPEDFYDRQPLISADQIHTLVADARVDNIEEIANELNFSSVRDLPDAAIIMAAYRKWGAACLDRLVGEFAFAVWNSQDRSLFLARDALGSRPLFWARGQSFFAFATMARGLFCLPEVSRELHERNLVARLAYIPVGGEDTLFRDVNRVLPGHCMTVTRSGIRAHRYWPPQRQRHDRFRSPDESAEALRETYIKAVRCRLRGVGQTGSMISAGWDSSSVTAIAARALADDGRRLTAFTAVPREGFAGPTPNNQIADESVIAARVLQEFPNVEHVRVSSATRSHLAEMEISSQFHDLPPPGTINSIWFSRIATEAKARDIRVLLGGDLGNFTVTYHGYGALPELFGSGRWLALARLMAGISRRGKYNLQFCLKRAIGPFLPPRLYDGIMRVAGREPLFELLRDSPLSSEMAGLYDVDAIAAERDWDMTLRPWADGRQMRLKSISRLDSAHFRPAFNARFGIDYRDPTRDRRLVELCLDIPEEHFIWQGRESSVFRDAMVGILPDWHLARRNRGTQSADWYEGVVAARDELAEYVEHLARSPLARRALDIPRLRATIAALPDPATPPEELAKGNWAARQVIMAHAMVIMRAAKFGHFIARMEGGNQ